MTESELDELEYLLSDIFIPPWMPLPGPQTMAIESQADETFYGGAAGGGKTDLLIGTAMMNHHDSIIFRREFAQLKGIRKRCAEIYNGFAKYNGSDYVWRFHQPPYLGKSVELGACQFDGDEQKYQGRPHDLKAFDEVTHFTEAQFRFLKGWNRTTRRDPNTGLPQRTRVIAAGNPPVNAEGQWVIRYWAPWLDSEHQNPAEPGELRWFVTDEVGNDREVPDNTPVWLTLDGVPQWVQPTSRTFIRAKVQDNTFLIQSGYLSVLQALPEPLRSRMLGGNFGVLQEDDEWQVIPSGWITEAQARWAPSYEEYLHKLHARHRAAGTQIADHEKALDDTTIDAVNLFSIEQSRASQASPGLRRTPVIGNARGDSDELRSANERDALLNNIPQKVGVDLSEFLTQRQQKVNSNAAEMVEGRSIDLPGARDVGVDVARGGRDKTVVSERIGSWFAPLKAVPGIRTPTGQAVINILKELGYEEWRCKIDVVGAGSSPVDAGRLEGMNVVAMNGSESSHATDRSGTIGFANKRAEWWWLFREALDPDLGLNIALPPDAELAADLAAPRWSLTVRGIILEDKKLIKKRIMRSPDRAEALINAFAQPNIIGHGFISYYREQVKLAAEQGTLKFSQNAKAKSQVSAFMQANQ
jgi:hypothetical protein